MSSTSNKPRLAVVLSRFPFPLEKGDKLRAYHQIKELHKEFEIHLIATSDIPVDPNAIKQLEEFCQTMHVLRLTKWSIFWNVIWCFFTKKPLQIGYFYSFRNKLKIESLLKSTKPNHIYCQLIRSSEYVKNYHACPKTLDYMDAFSMGIERRIEKSPLFLRWIFQLEARRLKLYERSIFDYFENKTIISHQDRELILHPERASIHCIPNGIDERFLEHIPAINDFDLVFIGNLSYAPNIEAVEFISKRILPLDPRLTCLISGANPNAVVQRTCKENNQITLQGWTEDIRLAYKRGKIFIAPMMIGTGMQNKILEAMALGIPCITSTLANNAIKAIDGETILVANSEQEFIEAIHQLETNPVLYARLSENAMAFARQNYSWELSTKELIKLMNEK